MNVSSCPTLLIWKTGVDASQHLKAMVPGAPAGPRLYARIVVRPDTGAVWLEPKIELARNDGMSARRLTSALHLVRRHEREIRAAWKKHFGR